MNHARFERIDKNSWFVLWIWDLGLGIRTADTERQALLARNATAHSEFMIHGGPRMVIWWAPHGTTTTDLKSTFKLLKTGRDPVAGALQELRVWYNIPTIG